MNHSLQMYLDLMKIWRPNIPKSIFGDRRRVEVLAWAVVARSATKTVNFNQWGEVVISRARYATCHERRFKRWFMNTKINPVAFYRPLLQIALADWPKNQPFYVALDTSDLGNGFILIRAALIYRGRAIPISWRFIYHSTAVFR